MKCLQDGVRENVQGPLFPECTCMVCPLKTIAKIMQYVMKRLEYTFKEISHEAEHKTTERKREETRISESFQEISHPHQNLMWEKTREIAAEIVEGRGHSRRAGCPGAQAPRGGEKGLAKPSLWTFPNHGDKEKILLTSREKSQRIWNQGLTFQGQYWGWAFTAPGGGFEAGLPSTAAIAVQ